MIKMITAFAVLFSIVLASCGSETTDEPRSLGIAADGIVSVGISSLPEGYHYLIDESDSIEAIVDYFDRLPIIADYTENPDEYSGMTWVVQFRYNDGHSITIYHFGNMFVRTEDGPWYKMKYDDAMRFGEIIRSISDGK